MTRIAEWCVSADQPVPTSSVQIATSRRNYVLATSRPISRSDLPDSRREAAAMDLQLTSVEPDVRSTLLRFGMYAARVQYSKLSISLDMLKNHTATREQSSNKQLYRLFIALVHLVNNLSVKSAFYTNRQGRFQVSACLPSTAFGVAKSFEARFVNGLARWLFTRKTLSDNSVFMDIVNFWEVNVPTDSNDALVWSHSYGHVMERFLA